MLSEASSIWSQPDALEPLLPRLREPVPRLGPVTDDGEAARGAAEQQHLPLGIGQLLRLVHDDVRERAGEQVRVGARQSGLVDEGVAEVLLAQLVISSSSRRRRAAMRSSTTRSICSRSAATPASWRRLRREASGSPSRCRAASSSGRSETVQAWGVAALQRAHLVGRRARARTGAGRPAPPRGRRRGRSARSAARPC